MIVATNWCVARMRALGLGGLVALACSACASEEVASSPGGMMPPPMAGVKSPAPQVATGPSSPRWSPSAAGLAAKPSDPSTLAR